MKTQNLQRCMIAMVALALTYAFVTANVPVFWPDATRDWTQVTSAINFYEQIAMAIITGLFALWRGTDAKPPPPEPTERKTVSPSGSSVGV